MLHKIEKLIVRVLAFILLWMPIQANGYEWTNGNVSPFSATGGDAEWGGDSDGSWRSGAITDSQTTLAEMTVSGPCLVSFKWKTSSESNYDWLTFYVDGEQKDQISGVMDAWADYSLTIDASGSHTLRWAYSKDGSVSNGEDCGWVTDFAVVPVVTCTVTFDANGGTIDGETITQVSVAEDFTVGTLPTPAMNGYSFLGWYTAAEGGDEVTAETVVTGDMTLYAHWEKIVYTYNYIDNGDGTVTLSRYDANGNWVNEPISPQPVGEFTLPSEIDGKRVVGISWDFFDGFAEMKSIVIPASVANISSSALSDAYGLTNISVLADNPAYRSIDGILYTKDGKTLVTCPRQKGGNVAVASGTEVIGSDAFYLHFDNLTSISLPDGLKVIESSAFYNCYALDSVVIPASVETIGARAFGYCSNLATVTFAGAEGDIDIAATAFVGTPYDAAKPFALIVDEWGDLAGIRGVAPTNLVLADHLNGQTLTGIGVSALSAGSFATASVTNVVVPEGVTWIYDSAFNGCAALESVTLPTSLQGIGYGVFGYCTSLRTIRIPAGVTSISDAFYGCENLTVVAPSTLRDMFSVPDGCTIEYYEIPEYTVTFDANGGTVNGSSVVAWTIWEGLTLEGGLGLLGNANGLPWPENDGYASSGWFTAAEGGDEVTADTVVTGDMTLYAHWVESPFTFSGNAPWVPEGDGVWRSGKVSVGQCSSADMFVVGPAKVSFKWKKTSSTNDRLRFAVDADYVGEDWSGVEDWQDFSYTINDGSGHTLRWVYAKEYYFGPSASTYGWIKDVVVTPLVGCTVTLDANGGVIEGGEAYAVSACEGESLELWNLTTRPSRDGYVFLGWIDPDGNIVYNFIVPGDVTLTAFWLEESPWLCDYVYNDDVCSDGLMIWGLKDDSAIENGVLTIPNTLTGIVRNGKVVQLPVVAIDDWELVGLSGIATVNLPSKLEYIGEGAFSGCKDLANVNGLTDGVKVGRLAFAGTPYYDTLPFGLDIEDNCVVGFHGPCNEIVRIDAGVTNIAWYAFSFGSYSYEVYDAVVDDWYERSEVEKLQSVVVPDSVESISEWSFEGCTNLTSVAIANPEVLIDGSAFNGCYNLGTIDVEKVGHTLVGWDLFRERNPTQWVYDPATGTHRIEEYEAAVIPTGVVMRVESIEPLIYGMPTDVLWTNYVWDVEAQDNIEVVSVMTNYLDGVWVTPAWAVNKYTVTLSLNGGDGEGSVVVEYGTKVGNIAEPTRTGHKFAGWFTAVEGGVEVTKDSAVTSDMTLYAHWIESPIDITTVTVNVDDKTVAVPRTWIAEHPALLESAGGDAVAALNARAANGRMSVVECYVLGLDPEEPNDDFRIVSFPMGEDGKPDLTNVVVDPSQESWNVSGARAVLKGAKSLGGDWKPIEEATPSEKATFRFFKVSVALP